MKLLFTDEVNSDFAPDFFINLNKFILKSLVEHGYDEIMPKHDETEVSLLLTDNANIQTLNSEYRKKDYPTDVLSFPMGDEFMLGDIVISLEKAMEQAKANEVTLNKEVAFLYIHGFLHLLGFDHETSAEDEKEMFDLQENILDGFYV